MTKPAAFVLQFTGLIVLIVGVSNESMATGGIGAIIILLGSWGIRRRMRRDK